MKAIAKDLSTPDTAATDAIDATLCLNDMHICRSISFCQYLWPLIPVADLSGHRTLRFAGTNHLLSTVCNRAFAVVGPHVWNTLL